MTDLRGFAKPRRLVEVRVTPKAPREQVTLDGNRVLIRVTCPPEAGKANKAVTILLAEAIGIAPARRALVKGQTARVKLVQVA